jgi:hypothetical protein
VRGLLVTANVVPSSLILVTLMMEAIRSSETSVLIAATRPNIPEDGILHFYYFRINLYHVTAKKEFLLFFMQMFSLLYSVLVVLVVAIVKIYYFCDS